MDKDRIYTLASDFLDNDAGNYLSAQDALREDLVGMRMYGAPLMGCASAEDPIFRELGCPEAASGEFRPPSFWLPQGRTVLSFFLPVCGEVAASNREDMSFPSPQWLHARMEGQNMIAKLTGYLCAALENEGYAAVAPLLDPRFTSRQGPQVFGSNWSERHVAYACGLGTFGLSRGLITQKGMAGRITSLVTDLELEPDHRAYSAFDAYCMYCGACVRNCPVHAISLETGKDNVACSAFLDAVKETQAPRYGCGKCQVGVPCEHRNPAEKALA